MEIGFETSIEGNIDFDGMISRLKEIDGKKVTAGLFGGFAQKKAMWQEYGTSRGIPSRPFLRNTLYQKSASWSAFVGPKIVALLEGGGANFMPELGKKMVDDIHATIDGGGFAPLAPATIQRKGSSKPLVDTGGMYGAVSFREE
ncbi:hypothetical protein [Loigolactobacillus bifermentans]|uniref:Uncharacterized protein n=1 Tax=Loigolactobacillus bifermentans DSM 20003 TaxID=1423726 RepID=A0A0R1HA22_9LACO|nr:hypothetical protein [Loigolactobacillus bifermentans]KRK40801.1 hypothetical protein FC07_GL002550 [Loigolactobacillus bifermentans DSM 20003]QGG59553.1 hypothetical protein LB003_03135 [Loigolactobacillus bifermentans]